MDDDRPTPALAFEMRRMANTNEADLRFISVVEEGGSGCQRIINLMADYTEGRAAVSHRCALLLLRHPSTPPLPP